MADSQSRQRQQQIAKYYQAREERERQLVFRGALLKTLGSFICYPINRVLTLKQTAAMGNEIELQRLGYDAKNFASSRSILS